MQLHPRLNYLKPTTTSVLSSRHSTSRASATLDQQLEAVLERDHIRVRVLLQLKSVGHDLDTPCALGLVLAHLEADPEVPGVLGHATEGVHGAIGVGFAIILEPEFCRTVSDD
jgi:hypothetical protein